MVLLFKILLAVIVGQLVINLALFLYRVLTRFGRMYYYREDGKETYFGHVKKSTEGLYLITDAGKMIGNREIGEIAIKNDRAWVRMKRDSRLGASDSFVEMGYVTREGKIYDLNDQLIAKCDPVGHRSLKQLFLMHNTDVFLTNSTGDVEEEKIGRCTESFRFGKLKESKFSLLTLSSAAIVLCEDYIVSEDETRSLGGAGWKDLAFLSTIIYVLFFSFFAISMEYYSMYPALGDMLSYVLGMLTIYFLLWWSLYMIKTDLSNRNHTFISVLNLVNRNTGIRSWNFFLTLISLIAIISTVLIKGYYLLPLFISIFTGTLVNWLSFTASPWEIKSPASNLWLPKIYKTKREKVKAKGTDLSNVKLEEKEYTWNLNQFGIGDMLENEKVKIVFLANEFAESDPAVRKRNPFFGIDSNGIENWKKSDNPDEFKKMIRTVVDGSDIDSLPFEVENKALDNIVASASHLCQKYNLADFELYNLVLSFCQHHVIYQLDKQSAPIGNAEEYVRFPVETLYDREGDCDCSAVLAYKLFRHLGVNAKLVIMEMQDGSGKHAAVLIKKENNNVKLPPNYAVTLKKYPEYAYCETTATGWEIGKIHNNIDMDSITALDL